MKELRRLGPVSRSQYREVKAEAIYLAAGGCNSYRAAQDAPEACRRPDLVVKWTQRNIPELSSIEYNGSEKHPQKAFTRGRIGGITSDDLMRSQMEFIDLYGMEFGSVKADIAFKTLSVGIQQNMRFEEGQSVVPLLESHYYADTTSRTYALAAQKGDIPLLLSAIR